jgi:hypothetical protein
LDNLIWGFLPDFLNYLNKICCNMKKLLSAFILLIGFSVYAHAQAAPAQTTAPKAKKHATTTTSAKPATVTAAKPAVKTTAKPATALGPTKKDGTADMRYKSNKDAAKAPPATVHTKKDGTADKRYKENKK